MCVNPTDIRRGLHFVELGAAVITKLNMGKNPIVKTFICNLKTSSRASRRLLAFSTVLSQLARGSLLHA